MAYLRRCDDAGNGIRHDYKPLWAGDTSFITDETDENLYAYVRSYENERMIIVVNIGKAKEEKTFNLKINSASCVLSKDADFSISDSGLTVTVSPKGYVILKEE
jgi:hypothetical protein